MRHGRSHTSLEATVRLLPAFLLVLALTPPHVRAACPQFAPPIGLAAHTDPKAVAIGDFNRDGRQDLAVLNFSTNDVSVILRNADWTFAAPVHYPAGTQPAAILAADFDRDGILDLAVANAHEAPESVSILPGFGDGTFRPAVRYDGGDWPAALAAADVNADGVLDLVIVSWGGGCSVLLGLPSGGFGGTMYVGATGGSGTVVAVAVGDLDRSGGPDIVVADSSIDTIMIFLNDGTGVFAPASTPAYPTGDAPDSVAIADFDRNGKLDVAVANQLSGTVAVFPGNGLGAFGPGVSYAVGSAPSSIAAADYTADGRIDLAVANSGDGTASILAGSSSGTFAAATSYAAGTAPVALASADLDNDARPDLVAVTASGASILSNSGFCSTNCGTLSTRVDYAAGSFPAAATSADFNRDGKPDVAVAASGSDAIVVMLGTGSGTLAAGTLHAVGDNPSAVVTADFDRDGKADLASANAGSGDVSVLLGNGSGGFAGGSTFLVGTGPSSLAAADFNGDGKLDLAIANHDSNDVSIMLGTGTGAFLAADFPTCNVGTGPVAVAAADLDLDGKLDLAVANATSVATPLSLLYGNGDGTFQAVVNYVADAGTPQSLAVADFDNDGRPDLAINSTVFMNGDVGFVQLPGGAGSGPTVAGDLNMDGKADLVAVQGTDLCMVPGNGDGLFLTGSQLCVTVPNALGVALADLDRDGKLDAAVAAGSSNKVSVVLNRCPAPDLTVSKTHSTQFTQGQNSDYTIVVTNNGNAPTQGTITVADVLPAGLSAVSMQGNGWTCSTATVTCSTTATLAASTSASAISLSVAVAPDAPPNVTNTAVVSGGGEVNTGNDTATDLTAIDQVFDLTVGSIHSGDFAQNQTGTYTLTVSNVGHAPSAGTVTLTDHLPGGMSATAMTGAGWECTVATVTCTRSDSLAATASYPPVTLTVFVAPAAQSANNQVSVSITGDGSSGNDVAHDWTTVGSPSDLIVQKSHDAFTCSGGSYSILVTNSGSPTAGTVTVVDHLPNGLTAVAMSGSGWTCDLGTATCTREDSLAGNASYPAITLNVTVAPDAEESVTNTVEVAGGSEVYTGNNSSTDPTQTPICADLTITKTHVGNFTQGGFGHYAVVVSNVGTGPTRGTLTVADTLPPAGLSFNDSFGGQGWTCSGLTRLCTRSDVLAPGASYPPIDIGVTVAGDAPSTVTNCATVSLPDEANTLNNTGCDPTTIDPGPDLIITKTHSGNFVQGQSGTYTITVTNVGPGPATGTFIWDAIPPELTITSMSGTGWTQDPDWPQRWSTTAVLGAGESYPPITVTVAVAPNAPASVTNTVTTYPSADVNRGNNSASDPTTITPPPDLTVASSHSADIWRGETGAVYLLTVTNIGPAPTYGTVTVSDTLPAGMTATAISGDGWTCDPGTLSCTRSDALAAGSSYPAITLTVDVAPDAAASLTNGATVSGGGDVTPTNNTASDPTTITAPPDLTVTMTHAESFRQGQNGAQYTITVTNSGPVPTTDIVIASVTLPAALTATAMNGSGWTCDLGTLSCTRTSPLGSAQIVLTVEVATNAAASVTSSVTVSGGGELDTGNDTATDPTAITQLPDLTIAKSHLGNFIQGQVNDADYTLVVANAGSAPTSGPVSVIDTLPAGLTADSMDGSGWICNVSTTTCSRALMDPLAAGGSYPPITLRTHVAGNAPASVVNTATVSTDDEVTTANNTATDPTTILPGADVWVTKTHTGDFARGQTGATYTITVSNLGPAATQRPVSIYDDIPPSLTITSIAGPGWVCVDPTHCLRSDVLTAGASYPPITVTVNVAIDAPDSVVNTVHVWTDGDVNHGDDTATDPTNILAPPDLTIAKVHTGNFRQGQTGAQYLITVSNAGDTPTYGGVTVVDTLPSYLTATEMSGSGWTCYPGTQSCTRSGALAGGASYPPITLTVNVAPNAPASVTNTVAVSGGGDLSPGNNTAADPTTITPVADLTVAKSHSGNFTQGQSGATWSVVVSNVSGAGPTSGTVTVVDALPAGLTATALSGSGWTCTLPALTCTRSSALAGGASYPPITVTVNVASNAPATVTNVASVSGGGELVTGNDSAADPTTIATAPMVAPTNLVATAASATQIVLTWNPVSGAARYDVLRRVAGGAFAVIAPAASATYTDVVAAGTAWVYQVRAVDASQNVGPPSNADLAAAVTFTNDPLVPGSTSIKAAHLNELRSAVAAVQAAAGLPPTTFTDTVAPGVAIKSIHVTELRAALDAARAALGLPAPPYTDSSLTGIAVKAIHLQEVRNRVK